MSTIEELRTENEQLKQTLQLTTQMVNDVCAFYEAIAVGYDPYVDTIDPAKMPETPRFIEFLTHRAAAAQRALEKND